MMFIRPWFLILLVVPVLFWFWNKKSGVFNPWIDVIDKKLRPFLLVPWGTGIIRKRFWILCVVWSLLSIAAAGPFFSVDSVPAKNRLPSTVIVLDMSPAMDKTQLNTAMLKIYAMLDKMHISREQVGLILSDIISYTAVPITPDTALVRQTVSMVKATLMPTPGINPMAGIEKASRLLKQSGADEGRILLITAGGFDEHRFGTQVSEIPHKVGVFALLDKEDKRPVSDLTGNFLKDNTGKLITAGTDLSVLKRFVPSVLKTPDETDVNMLLSLTRQESQNDSISVKGEVLLPHDLGPWVILGAIPFMLLLFRRGMFFVWFVIFMPMASYADMFLRPDQVDYKIMERAHALFEQKEYQKSADTYGSVSGKIALYNRATATAHAGQIHEAVQLYDTLLKQYPDHADAKYNKEYLEKQIKQEQQRSNQEQKQSECALAQPHSNGSSEQAQNQSQQTNEKTEDSKDKTSDQNNQESQNNQTGTSENVVNTSLSQDQKVNSLKEGGATEYSLNQEENQSGYQNNSLSKEEMNKTKNVSDELTQTEQQKMEEKAQSLVYKPASTDQNALEKKEGAPVLGEELDQESQQLFNRIQQDPSRILKYRLYRQYQQNRQQGGMS